MAIHDGYTLSRGGWYKDEDLSGPYAIDSEGNATLIGGGGGGAGGTVEVSNFPATQPVSGTVTVNGIATAGSTQQGAIANPAYTDATGAANGTMIALLKGIYVQLAEINAKTPPLP